MIDIVLLRLIKKRKDWLRVKDALPNAPLSPETRVIVEDFARYFKDYPSHDAVDLLTFLPRFKQWHPTLNDEQFSQYKGILRNIVPDADDDQARNIIQDMADITFATHLRHLLDEFEEGELEDDLYAKVNVFTDNYRKQRGIKVVDYIRDDIDELLKDEFDNTGIRWRLACLNNSMRPMRGGDFGIIAGRPDQGKTTFMTSEAAFVAPQLPEERNVVWLNNEGMGKRIKPRLFQSVLGCSMEELKIKSAAGTLKQEYIAAMGRIDKVRIFDIHSYSTGMVENIIQDNNPGLVIFDMIDNIRGFGDAARTDLMLEFMYQWAREMMVKYDSIGWAGSQISNEGNNVRFPTLPMLKDSKTGKQGACDFQLMIGSVDEPAFMHSRFIGLPKNKLQRPDGKKDPKAEVAFLATLARYQDIPEGS